MCVYVCVREREREKGREIKVCIHERDRRKGKEESGTHTNKF
jgi:hypothetical protein